MTRPASPYRRDGTYRSLADRPTGKVEHHIVNNARVPQVEECACGSSIHTDGRFTICRESAATIKRKPSNPDSALDGG